MTSTVPIDEYVDVVAVTGFLGAGKTTLIKALLDSNAAAGNAVLVSEFGEIGIDDAILADASEGVVQLANGCVCCRVGSSLEQTLRNLFVARLRGHVSPFHRLFIETSGMSDPVEVVAAMHSRPIREMRYRMKGTITAFDRQFGVETVGSSPEAAAQLAAADCIVLTKCDLDLSSWNPICEAIAASNPGAPILRSVHGLDEASRPVLESAAADARLSPTASVFRAVAANVELAVGRHTGVRSMSMVLHHPLDWPKLVAAIVELATRNDARLLRFKGILSVEGVDAPVVAHGVRDTLYPPAQLREWPLPRGESRVVLIYTGCATHGFERAARRLIGAAASHIRQEGSRAA